MKPVYNRVLFLTVLTYTILAMFPYPEGESSTSVALIGRRICWPEQDNIIC